MKLRHIVLFLLVTGIALLTVAMPVSAQLNEIQQGNTVLLGEQGLDVTNAVGVGTAYLGWWSGSDYSTPPTRQIDLSGYIQSNFNIVGDDFTASVASGSATWWRLNSAGQTNPTDVAFVVTKPQSSLRIRDLHRNASSTITDVTDKTAPIGDILDFSLNSSTLHYIYLRNTSANFNCKIVVKSPNGVTYSKLWDLTPLATQPQKDLTNLKVNSTPWYWSSGNGTASDYNKSWDTAAKDPVTNSLIYSPGEYQVTIECNENNLGFVGITRTITLEEEKPVITVNPSSLIRGNKFYTTVKGLPNTDYIIWLKDCVACPNGCCSDQMTGACCDEAPWIVDGQEGVTLPLWSRFNFTYSCDSNEGCICPPSYCSGLQQCGQCGEYPNGQYGSRLYGLNNTLIEWCGCLCTKELGGIMPMNVSDNHYSYALIHTDDKGERVIEWQTRTCTKPSSYLIHTQRWIPRDVCELDLERPYAETCVNVQKGVVTLNTEVCDVITDSTYLGETVRIFGTNTDSKITYLFITGPCQSCAGENMNVTKTVVNWDPSTFTVKEVKSNGTWEYYWETRNLEIDLGQYTIYATSMPNDAPTLEGVPCHDCSDVGVSCAAWTKKPFTFLEPTITADVNPKILQIVCCSGPSIIVDGTAMGLRGEAIGQKYNTIPVGIWVFGENKVAGVKYFFDIAEVDCVTGKFSKDLSKYIDTLALVPGTYTVVVQHPMYNHRLDIIPETSPNAPGVKWICAQSDSCWMNKFDKYVVNDEVWYPDVNRKFVVTATPVRWSKLFVIDGPDRLAGTAALNALLTGFADPNIDDKIVVLTFKVESNNALQAGFSGIPTSGGAPLSVQFTDISIGYPTTWAWDFGDGYTSTEQNPLHVYENAGTYSVTLSVTGLSGSSSVTKNNYVTVTTGPTPTGTVTVTPTTPPPASTIVLNTGWNFVSTPRALADGSNTAGVVFAGVNTGGRSIYYYNAETMSWQALTASSLVKPLDGIWIYSTTSTTVPLTYKNDPLATPPTKQLFAGWNSIGFSNVNPASARDTLQSVQSQWTQVIGYNSASQSYETSIIKGGSGSHSDTNPMNPFKGYWLFMNAPGTLAAISA